MSSNHTIIVYRDELIGVSETFIRAQAESLKRFRPFFVGLRRRPGLRLPIDQVEIISRPGLPGKLQRARFRLLGPSPSLRRSLARKQPALIHAHFGPDGCNAMALADALDVPLIVSLHGYDVTQNDDHHPPSYLRRRARLMNKAARFICVSNFIREQAVTKGFPESKIVVHYTGIDTDFFRAEPDIPRSPIVLFVGRLVPKKGCRYLLTAMAHVQREIPAAKLVVIGDGPLRLELEERARAVLKSFKFLGAQQPQVVKTWMNRASVFCTPSIVAESGDAEGFGMVFAEAQAMGLPVVGFASGGVSEAAAHGETALLVKERDCEALAAGLLTLLRDPDLWRRFSFAGEQRVRRLFDVRKQARALEGIYESVLTEGSRAEERPRRPHAPRHETGDSQSLALHLPPNEPGVEISIEGLK
jgi:colanic acid/amylovoran biosynthesis glycosyltransferase